MIMLPYSFPETRPPEKEGFQCTITIENQGGQIIKKYETKVGRKVP